MAWLLVPLQYLYLIWRAQTLIGKAAASSGRQHERLLRKAAAAVAAKEKLQIRFPRVTNWIDIRRDEEALRFHISK